MTSTPPAPPRSRNGGPRPHVGVLLPAGTAAVVRSELLALRPGAARYHYAELPAESGPDGLPAAVTAGLTRLSSDGQRLAGVLLADTTPVRFPEGLPIRPVTAFEAIVEALGPGRHRAVIAAPGSPRTTRVVTDGLTRRGVEVLDQASLDWPGDPARITLTQIRRLIRGLNVDARTAADVLILASTAWPTRALIGELTDYYGLRVLTANQAMARYAATMFRAPAST